MYPGIFFFCFFVFLSGKELPTWFGFPVCLANHHLNGERASLGTAERQCLRRDGRLYLVRSASGLVPRSFLCGCVCDRLGKRAEKERLAPSAVSASDPTSQAIIGCLAVHLVV